MSPTESCACTPSSKPSHSISTNPSPSQFDQAKLSEDEAVAELERLDREHGGMTPDERHHFESILWLKAMVRGWTGDWDQQPATSVLAAYRQMIAERGAR